MTDETSPAGAPRQPEVLAEAMPPEAAQVFGAQTPLAAAYADLLCRVGVIKGVIGPREVSRIWTRHLLNCAALAPLLPPGARVCDLGSGAGLPGIPLVLARPDLQMTLLEPLLRRATFLTETIATLGIGGVAVDRGRAEERRGAPLMQYVVARAVGSLDKLVLWAMPLLEPGGELFALKGESASEELSTFRSMMRRAGAEESHIEVISLDGFSSLTTVVRVRRAGTPCRPAAPRSRRGRR